MEEYERRTLNWCGWRGGCAGISDCLCREKGTHFGGMWDITIIMYLEVDCDVLINLMDHASCGKAIDGNRIPPKIAEKCLSECFISTKLRSCLPHEDKAS